MQKLINTLAIASFLVSASIVGGGVYLFVNKDNIVEGIKTEVTDQVSQMIPDMIQGAMGGLTPDLPQLGGGSKGNSPIPLPF